MTILQSIILGIVQGITEFLPISSSAHLVIVPSIFGWEQQSIVFDIIIHLATLTAIIYFYRKKLLNLGTAILSIESNSSRNTRRILINISLTTIPLVLSAVFFKSAIDNWAESIYLISFALIVIGIFLVNDRLFFKDTLKISQLTKKSAFLIGLAQAFALLRGVSRSGATILAGGLMGLSKKEAIDYAFLASIPAILASFFYLLIQLTNSNTFIENPLSLIAGFISALISSYLAISFLLKFIQRHDFKLFGYYRIVLGIFLIISISL